MDKSTPLSEFIKQADVEQYKIKIPWGSWELDGTWHYNPFLEMSEDEQRRQNIENGYKC